MNCSHCVVICLSITQSVSSADTGEEGEELNTEVQSVDKQSLFTTVFDTLGKCNSNVAHTITYIADVIKQI